MAGALVKHDWYQTDKHVVINILAKNTRKDVLDVKCINKQLTVKFTAADGTLQLFEVYLANEVDESSCIYRTLSSKIEIKLLKSVWKQWVHLNGIATEAGGTSGDLEKIREPFHKLNPSNVFKVLHFSDVNPLKYPSSSAKAKDWNKVEAEIAKAEEENAGKGDGESALNELFQKIYSQGSDEVKKAMNKSFSESGGTVLSTNWSEIERDKTTVRAPDGMEWKQWDA